MTQRLVLLTGATGFVGTQVLRALAAQDVRVRLVLRGMVAAEWADSPAIESIVTTLDLFAQTAHWWAEVCAGVDTVVHVAWYAEPGVYLQSPRNLDCLAGTLALAQGAARARVRRFCGVGTCFEYELSAGVLSVDTPLRPATPYAGAKAAAFQALSTWLPAQQVEFVWCRLFYLFGEGEDARRLVPYLRKTLAAGEPALLTSGRQIRDFLDVREAGHRVAQAALGAVQGPVNIASGTPITVRQLAEQIADEYGRRDLLRFGSRDDNLVDPPCVVGIPSKVFL
jgi:nucleoside-diphosphate-sugar epimerase